MKSTEEDPVVLASTANGVSVSIDDCETPMMTSEKPVTPAGDTAASSDGGDESESNKNIEDASEAESDDDKKTCWRKILGMVWAFYWAYDFPINVMIAICIALAHPEFGAVTIKPKITAGWVATATIFFISGLGLKTKELFKVMFHRLYFNIFVEVYNFFLVSAVVFGVSRALASSGALPQALADGLAITATLPMSINAVIVMTQASHGDEAAAIFHTAFSNMTGIFLSPVMIVLYLPSITVNVDLLEVFKELTYKIIIPLAGGQLVHLTCKFLREFYFAHKKAFKKTQEYCLIFIIYTVFCRQFYRDSEKAGLGSVAVLIIFVFLCMASLKYLAWYLLKLLFKDEPKLRVMGVFGCTQKTIALGIPLIVAIFGKSDNVGMYTLPILIWHPMQLVVGSTIAPRLRKFVASETERLGLIDDSRYLTNTTEASITAAAEDKV